MGEMGVRVGCELQGRGNFVNDPKKAEVIF